MTAIERASRCVRQQRDVRTRWRRSFDAVDESSENGRADASTLMIGQHRHVGDVEVPPPVADHPTHSNDRSGRDMDDVDGRPTSVKCERCLLECLRRQTGASSDVDGDVWGRSVVDDDISLAEHGGRAYRHPFRVGGAADAIASARLVCLTVIVDRRSGTPR